MGHTRGEVLHHGTGAEQTKDNAVLSMVQRHDTEKMAACAEEKQE